MRTVVLATVALVMTGCGSGSGRSATAPQNAERSALGEQSATSGSDAAATKQGPLTFGIPDFFIVRGLKGENQAKFRVLTLFLSPGSPGRINYELEYQYKIMARPTKGQFPPVYIRLATANGTPYPLQGLPVIDGSYSNSCTSGAENNYTERRRVSGSFSGNFKDISNAGLRLVPESAPVSAPVEPCGYPENP